MKTKKRWKVLVVIVCILGVIAGVITSAIFAVRAKQLAEGKGRVEEYMSELSAYSPDTDIANIRLDIDVCAYAGDGVFETDSESVYNEIKEADDSLGITFCLSPDANNPTMSLSVYDQRKSIGSVYLYNGRIYVCPYYGDYHIKNKQIAAIYDAQELLGDVNWSQIGAENWGDIQTDLNLNELFGLLGLENEEELDMLSSIADDPEQLFTDARREDDYSTPRYIFDMDISYFESYFDQLEGEISEEYDAKFTERSACMYISLEQADLRLTMAFSEEVSFGANSQTIVTVFDMTFDVDAGKPYLLGDVFDYDALLRGIVASDVDRSDESLTTLESGAVQSSYQLDSLSTHSCKYRPIGAGMFAIFYENRADIVSSDGRMVRTIEYQYNIVDIYADGQYMTVVLGEPLSEYEDYLFSENFIPGGYDYKCITYDLSDFSVASEVILETDHGQKIRVACQCGDTFVFGGSGWCYFIDVLSGEYVYNTDFYTPRTKWYYDDVSDRFWLYDNYIGAVVVDLKDYSYTMTATMPEEEEYLPYRVEVEGYEYVDCFAHWQEYELALARADAKYYLVIYDGVTGEVISSVEAKDDVESSFFLTDDDRLVWWDYNALYVVDLNALLGQE